LNRKEKKEKMLMQAENRISLRMHWEINVWKVFVIFFDLILNLYGIHRLSTNNSSSKTYCFFICLL